jgi:hypothetical protein
VIVAPPGAAARRGRIGLAGSGALLALLALGPAGARADTWPGPRTLVEFSESGRRFVRIVPGQGVGETAGFAGAPAGRPATALFYALQPDRSYARLAEVTLVNPVAPVSALVSDDGHLVTFDNWHNFGFGKVVAIYGPAGGLIRSYELEALYPASMLARVPRTVSSRHWRCQPVHFVEREQKSVYVPEVLGGYFVLTLATGDVVYTPGARTACNRPAGPHSWTSVGP